MPRARKWYKPKKETGWKKTQKPTTRRSKLLSSTSKSMKMHDRYVQAARRAQALANVTKDKATATKAKQDANYFYKKAEMTK